MNYRDEIIMTNLPIYENRKRDDLFFEAKDVVSYLLDLDEVYETIPKVFCLQDLVLLSMLDSKSFELGNMILIEVVDLMEAITATVDVLKPRTEYRINLVEKSVRLGQQIQYELKKRGI